MKKFKVNVIRTDEYKIEIDETIWTPEEIEDWANHFYPAKTPADIAEHLAESITNRGYESFLEGFGYVRVFCNGRHLKVYKSLAEPIPDDEYTKGLKVEIIDDDDVEVEAIEIDKNE